MQRIQVAELIGCQAGSICENEREYKTCNDRRDDSECIDNHDISEEGGCSHRESCLEHDRWQQEQEESMWLEFQDIEQPRVLVM